MIDEVTQATLKQMLGVPRLPEGLIETVTVVQNLMDKATCGPLPPGVLAALALKYADAKRILESPGMQARRRMGIGAQMAEEPEPEPEPEKPASLTPDKPEVPQERELGADEDEGDPLAEVDTEKATQAVAPKVADPLALEFVYDADCAWEEVDLGADVLVRTDEGIREAAFGGLSPQEGKVRVQIGRGALRDVPVASVSLRL